MSTPAPPQTLPPDQQAFRMGLALRAACEVCGITTDDARARSKDNEWRTMRLTTSPALSLARCLFSLLVEELIPDVKVSFEQAFLTGETPDRDLQARVRTRRLRANADHATNRVVRDGHGNPIRFRDMARRARAAYADLLRENGIS